MDLFFVGWRLGSTVELSVGVRFMSGDFWIGGGDIGCAISGLASRWGCLFSVMSGCRV